MKKRKQSSRLPSEKWHKSSILLCLYDVIVVNIAYVLALWMRFDCRYSQIPLEFIHTWARFAPFYTLISIGIFCLLKLYSSLWRLAGANEVARLLFGNCICGIVQVFGTILFFGRLPLFYYVVGLGGQIALMMIARFGYRFISLEHKMLNHLQEKGEKSRVMLIGAGAAGQLLLRDLHGIREATDDVCCIIDDDPSKWGKLLEGVPIVGGRDDILVNAEKYKVEKIFMAIPSASAEVRRDILDICKETGCEMKSLPSVYQLVQDNYIPGQLKEVSITDLLGRDPIHIDMQDVFDFLSGKVILVTGGGGSIGSELCRQIAAHSPRQLIIFDVYENNAYDIQLELREKYPNLNLVTLIGSVRDSRRLAQIFSQYRPDVVYHAAAHKHVPLMEDSPCESIKNNVIGTYKTAYAAMMYGCQRFVLISTDKAVNPTNIMGASKRLCEMVIQTFDSKIKEGKAQDLPCLFTHKGDMRSILPEKICTEYVAVRFGNVLGSNGSVIPVFKRQIEKGGPITVTHPDIIRYFMTIPEAVSLVLQAGTNAGGGEIFVLDMGSPVKIDTLARNLIRLSGLRPDVDIKIVYTGLRPGEKLYEEKLMAEEGLRKTKNELIHIGCPIPFDTDSFIEELVALMVVAYENEEEIRSKVQAMVPTYHPAGEHGSEKKGKVYELLSEQAANGE